jgi:hypothetical protein
MVSKFKAVVGSLAALALGGLTAVVPANALAAANYATQPGPHIQGTIASIPGKYSIEVRTPSGKLDDVSLHQGTIINPTGITLEPGYRVRIYGYPDNGSFVANEIDTPYHYIQQSYAPAPYWGAGYWGAPYWGAPYWGAPYYAPVVPYVVIVRR